MKKIKIFLSFFVFVLVLQAVFSCSPSGPDLWFKTSLEFNKETFPGGVTLHEEPDYGYYFLRNSGSEPLYIVERYQFNKEHYEEDYPNSGLPADFVPIYKLVSDSVYFYNESESGSFKQGWILNKGGFNDSASYQLKITEHLLDIEGGSKNIAADDRPENVEIPKPQPFKILTFYAGAPIEIEGTVHYRLNDEYDPKALAKGIESCRLWNATQGPSFFLTLFVFIIVLVTPVVVIIYLILRKINKKQK